MQDNLRSTELRALCIAAQHDFNDLAREFKAACEAAEAAQAAQAQANDAINASFDEVRALARALADRGEPVPVEIADGALWLSLNDGRQRGELHGILEGVAAEQGFGPDAHRKAA
jgi:hypothetical protein